MTVKPELKQYQEKARDEITKAVLSILGRDDSNDRRAGYRAYVGSRVGLRVFGTEKYLNAEGPLVKKIQENDDSQEERVKELETIRKRIAELERGQKLGLVWRDIPEDVETLLRDEMPVLIPKPDLDIAGGIPSDQSHVLIEGDNLHALHVLQATHKGAIDVIYIDPPYNTGKEFIYNDKLIDKDNPWRHSTWLSFMEKRLKLAEGLLSHDGIILVSISDHEGAYLQLLMDEIFGEVNRLGPIIWFSEGVNDNTALIKKTHEYILVYRASPEVNFSQSIQDPNVDLDDVIKNSVVKNGTKNPPSSISLPIGFPASFEKGIIKKSEVKSLKVSEDIKIHGAKTLNSVTVTSGWSSKNILEKFIDSSFTPVLDSKGQKTTFVITAAGNIEYWKIRDQSHVLSVIRNLGTVANAGAELHKMGIEFDYPKPVGLLKYLIQLHGNINAKIIDFFAGTGTTMHAVAELNATDGGTRQCILVTNNENGICREVTQPRLKAVLTGKWADKQKHDPLPGSVSFYKTGFIKRSKSPDRMRTEIAKHTVDLIAIKEGAGTTVSRSGDLTILYGLSKTVAVAAGLEADHGKLWSRAEKKVREGDKKVVYLFTWSDQGVEEETAELWPGWVVQPLPSEMLAALRRNAPASHLFDVDGSSQ